MDDKTAILARLPIFASLDGRSLEAIATLARIISSPAGTVLMHEDEPAESFYVIVTGTVHVERDGDFVRSMSDGGFLGEIGLVKETTHTATVTCTTACELVQLGRHEFGRVIARFPEVGARVDAAVARRPHEGSG
ncbi:MAG: family transcriptional regulator, cyclic receptor protein [Chloroflexota bacterium]|jgi:CRP-like cAMP-binding protein|nr:family transcriptional regulator, cyclic receptor protein [Chloroflexota bacterium]